MLVLARHLHGASVVASDGVAGKVYELLFDDQNWKVRDLVVETGGWWQSRDVLIEPMWIESIDWDGHRVRVSLPRERIEHSPPYDPAAPVEAEQELAASGRREG